MLSKISSYEIVAHTLEKELRRGFMTFTAGTDTEEALTEHALERMHGSML